MPQTTIQNQAAIRKGSVKLQIGDNFSSLVDVGAIRDPQFQLLADLQSIEFDNVDELKQFNDGQRAQINFVLAEINLTNLAQFDAGLINYSTVAGSLVSGATQVLTSGEWNVNIFYPIANQNGDGSAITVNSVTGATDGALTVNDDFDIVVVDGVYGIVVQDVASASNLTTISQNLTIDYDYTPNASKNITFNDVGTKTEKVVRIVNTDTSGNEFRIDLQNVSNVSAWNLDFASDNEAEVATVNLSLEGNIVEIVDEQQTT